MEVDSLLWFDNNAGDAVSVVVFVILFGDRLSCFVFDLCNVTFIRNQDQDPTHPYIRVRVDIIGHARIRYVRKYRSCMV